MSTTRGGIVGNLRFFAHAALALVGLSLWLGLTIFINERIPGGLGLTIALVGGVSLMFGLLLAYHIAIDWLNLRVIHKAIGRRQTPKDGSAHAVEGTVRTRSQPMTAPFTGEPCAAYRFRIARDVHSRLRGSAASVTLAEGLHMVPTRIETADGPVALRSFPGVESELWQSHSGRDWSPMASSLMSTFDLTAGDDGQRAREALIQRVLHEDVAEVHADFMLAGIVGDQDRLTIVQEFVPADETVCAIGTWDAAHNAFNGTQPRLGPNLMVYRGSAAEVSARLGRENSAYARLVAVLVGIGLLATMLALLPPSLSSRIPLIGWGEAREPVFAYGPGPVDLSASERAAIDREIDELRRAGDAPAAMAIAVRANLIATVRQLLADDGVSANAAIRLESGSDLLPLFEAARLGYFEITQLLLESGADPNQVMDPAPSHLEGKTALDLALEFDRCEVAGLLLRYRAIYRHGMENYRCP